MATQRLLIVMIVACASQGAARAQKIAIPHWVRTSAQLGIGTAATAQHGGQALEHSEQGENATALLETAKLVGKTQPLLTKNHRLLTARPTTTFRGTQPVRAAGAGPARAAGAGVARTLQLLQIGAMIYDLTNGNMQMREAQIQVAQMAVSSVVSAATFAGMVYFAGSVGTASTGTAIATLHGAAYASATAAWWGGGSLAAGGLGVWGGTIVMTGGAAIVAAGAGIAVYKVWNMLDPAERDAVNRQVAGLLQHHDLTDSSSRQGAIITMHSQQLRKWQQQGRTLAQQ
ncbi:MAG: hypothetical protein LC104_14170 [Bacteroidales bacterium]|nr:hypothetical protein [Bacteroidales bacterium]